MYDILNFFLLFYLECRCIPEIAVFELKVVGIFILMYFIKKTQLLITNEYKNTLHIVFHVTPLTYGSETHWQRFNVNI